MYTSFFNTENKMCKEELVQLVKIELDLDEEVIQILEKYYDDKCPAEEKQEHKVSWAATKLMEAQLKRDKLNGQED